MTLGSSYSVGEAAEGSDIVISFTKPDDWSDSVNVYVYQEGDVTTKNADWPGEAMTKGSDGVYSYTIKSGIFGEPKLVFNDGDGKHQYPRSGGILAEDGKSYKVEEGVFNFT